MDRKRARIDFKFQSKKRAKRCYADNDWISQLPDDILIAIISFLSLKEAARTSVLSSRWINLWRHISCLNFDADSASNRIGERYMAPYKMRHEYVKWVNCIIRSHKAVTLEEFRICFALRGSAKKAIPRWLKFAFTRHIQRLEFDCSGYRCTTSKECVFPEEFLTQSSRVTQSSRGASTSQTSSDINFKSLKALSLKYVDVTGEAIEFFLRNCPLLEKLVVGHTDKISNLEVCGPSLALKHLELDSCNDLKSIKVSAPNLTLLTVPGVEGILLENVPMLVEVSVKHTKYHDSFRNLLPALSCYIFQLEILTLELTADPETGLVLSNFPEIPKLKKLVIDCSVKRDQSLIGLTSLISASPYLQEFVLVISRRHRNPGFGREVNNTIKFPHHHLEVFKFSGYDGCASDVELVQYISENCVVLEKIIIGAYNLLPYYYEPVPDQLNEIETARDKLKQQVQLEGQVPHHIELVIFDNFNLTL